MTRATLPVLLLAATLASVFPMDATATDWYVDAVNGSDATGDGSQGNPWGTLKYAASTTNGTGTEGDPCVIHLAEGTYSPSTNGENYYIRLGVTGDYCSLIGAGRDVTILDAEGTDRVLYTEGCEVSVSDLTITGGGDPDGNAGGGIKSYVNPTASKGRGTITVERCVVTGNNQGSGVEATRDAYVNIKHCTITNNTKSEDAGAGVKVWPVGMAVLLIEGCDISDNSAFGPYGEPYSGGIHARNCSGVIKNCAITGNYSYMNGGGVSVCAGAVDLENCVITGNTAERGGGFYPYYFAYCDVLNCLIAGNTAEMEEGAGVFVGRPSSGMGTVTSLTNCTITDNNGSGVFIEQDDSDAASEANMYNCIVWGQTDSIVNVPCSMVSHCDLSDGSCNGENGNISQDPLFVTGAQGDYYLSHAGVNANGLRIADWGLRNVSHADVNGRTASNQMGYNPQMNRQLVTANCQLTGANNVKETKMTRATLPVLLLAATLASVFPMDATATDWYVDAVNGSDATGDGSEESPWKSITVALDNTTGTEEDPAVLHIAPGTYSPSSTGESFPLRTSGEEFYSFIGAGCEQSIIDAQQTKDVFRCSGDYSQFKGLTLTGGAAPGGYGSVITVWDGDADIERCVITANTGYYAVSFGDLGSWGNLAITDSVITDNHGPEDGGGALRTDFSYVQIKNCLVANNSREDGSKGGGLYLGSPSQTTVVNCSIVGNQPQGVYQALNASTDIVNTIIWNNGDDIWAHSESDPPTLSHCDISDGDGAGSDGNISEEPLFVTGPQGDNYLSHYETEGEDSPCIDAGDRPSADLGLDDYTTCTDGRPDTGTVDMGYHYSLGPELSDPTHAPDSGRSDVDFTFTVHYYSPAGSEPASIEVFVNGTAHDMTLSSGGAANGIYSWTGTIPEDGQSTYHFEATDSMAQYVRLPASGELDGPMVYDDYVKPDSSCSAPAMTNSSAVDVDYTSSDDNSGVAQVALWMQFDGHGYYDSGHSSTEQSGSFAVTFGSGNGTYDFYTIASDRATNEEDAPGSPDATVVFDSTAPTSSASCQDSSNSSPIDVDFTASDGLTGVDETALWYRCEGGAWTDSGQTLTGDAGTFSFALSDGEGTYEFYTVSIDEAGNDEAPPAEADCSVFYDCTLPESSCDCSPWVNVRQWISVWFTASDNLAGLDSVTLWYRPLPSGAWTEYDTADGETSGSFSFDLPGGVDDVEFYTIATDNAGNVEASPGEADCVMGYDGVKPDSSCTCAPMTNETTMPVDFTASDEKSGVASTTLLYKYEEGGWGTSGLDPETGTSGQFAFTAYLGDGTYYFATWALDNAGNQQDFPAEADCETVLDTTAPVSSCSVDVEYTSSATIAVQYSASDAVTDVALVRLFVSRDGSAWDDTGLESDQVSGEFEYDFAGLDGTYRLVTVATDGAGNVESVSAARACTVIYDTALPSSTCTSPEVSNDPSLGIDYEVSDPLAGGSGVMLYVCFTADGSTTSAITQDWEYTGAYDYGPAGTIDYTPPCGAGTYQFFTIGRDRAGNFETMKDTADCACDYNEDYALSSCWGPLEASSATLAIVYAGDVGEAGLDHVELWYAFSIDGADWPDEWADSGLTSDATDGTLVFERPHGDGYYRFCTIALNDDLLAEPFPIAYDCEVAVDATVPSSSLLGPNIAPSLPVTVSYHADDQDQEGRFFSGVESVEVWYSYEGSSFLYEAFYCTPATIASGSAEFAPTQEGIYELWSTATDAFGNREPTPLPPDVQLAVDLTPPASLVASPAYSQSFPMMISAVATDAITDVTGVSVYYSLDGADWLFAGEIEASRGTLGFTPDEALEGVYGFVSVAADSAGHEEALRDTPDTETTVDWTAPDASVSAPQYAKASPITLDYEATDGLAGVAEVTLYHRPPGADEWTQAGLSSSEPDGTFNYEPADGQGEYDFAVVADDLAANTCELPPAPHATTIYDTAAPTSGASSPTFSKTGTVQVSYTASDPTSGVASVALWYQHDGGAWVNSGLTESAAEGEFEFDASSDGSYGFATKAIDLAGNSESLPEDLDSSTVVDTVKPASSCDSTGLTRQFPIAVTFTASDVTSGVSSVELWYRHDGGSWTDSELESDETSGSFDFSPAEHPDGVYGFATRARDHAGNIEALPSAGDSSTLVDTVPPASSCSCPSDTRTFPVEVTYTGSDGSSGLASVALWYKFDGGGWLDTGLSSSSSSGAFDFTPDDEREGVYGFATKGRDVAGNAESLPEAPDCTVDVVFTSPVIDVEPSSVEFGEVRVSRTVSEEIVIGNVGDADLEVSSIREQAVGFSLDLGELDLPLTIAPDDSVSFNVTFKAASARRYTGLLEIESNDPDTPHVAIDMEATGRAPTGLTFTVETDADTYRFGDTIAVTVAAENDGDGIAADVYLALAHDFGGPEVVLWSAAGFDNWQEGIVAWLPGTFLNADLSIEATLFDMPIPEYMLGQPRAGQYTVLLAAFEPGTFDAIGDIASTTFDVESDAFLEVILSSNECRFGDTLSIGLRVSIPEDEPVPGDIYAVVIAPDGELWSASGLSWATGVSPWFTDVEIPAGTETTLENLWQMTLPEAPFDRVGSYIFLATSTEPGTLAPQSDIGITALSISQ